MREFANWKNEVTAQLVERGIPVRDESLVVAWNSNHSVEYTVMAENAEWLCNQPAARFNLAERCGCFHCARFFLPDDIIWDGIAECPYCGLDAVVPESEDFPLNREMLRELAEKQFARNPFV